MSIPEFTATVRSHLVDILSKDRQKLARTIGTTAAETKVFRKSLESASRHIALLSNKGTQQLIDQLIGHAFSETIDEDVSKYASKLLTLATPIGFEEFVLNKKLPNTKGATATRVGDSIEISNIPQANMSKYFIEYIETFIPKKDRQIITVTTTGKGRGKPATTHEEYTNSVVNSAIEYVRSNIQAGHLIGIFSIKTAAAFGAQVSMTEGASSYRDITVSIGGSADKELSAFASGTLKPILRLLLDADFITSSIVNKVDLAARATKRVFDDKENKVSTELQFALDNEGAGSVLQRVGGQLNNLISQLAASSSNTGPLFTSFINGLDEVAALVMVEASKLSRSSIEAERVFAKQVLEDTNKIVEGLIRTKGSPSLLDSPSVVVSSILKGKKVPKRLVSKVNTNISTKSKVVLPSNSAIKKITNIVRKVSSLASKGISGTPSVKISSRPSVTYGTRQSSVNLEAILRARINEQVAQNMGSGSDRRILNYRTGRLAESVDISRVSESRAGMISVFYNYMKNPYATFSDGGQQQSPKTRDPKTLISKSIREIAAPIVGNRLRSVLV